MSKKPKPIPAGKYRVKLLGEPRPGSGHSGPIFSTFGHSVPVHYTQAEWRKYCAMRDACQRERDRRFRAFTFDYTWIDDHFKIEDWDLL